jgi:hypothetical protein
MNKRAVLASFTLVISWVLTTFFLPFFATYARDKSVL